MKTFKGIRSPQDGPLVFVFVEGSSHACQLPTYQMVRREANSFEWGFFGAAVRQLALAILVDVFGRDDERIWHYAEFARDVLARAGATFEVSEEAVRSFVERLVGEAQR